MPVPYHRLLASAIRARYYASSSQTYVAREARRVPKKEGSIGSFFASLNGTEEAELSSQFTTLKQSIWSVSGGKIEQSWKEVVAELETATKEIAVKGSEMIPRIRYEDLQNGLTFEQVQSIKKVGTVIITGAVSKEEALGWKSSVREYVSRNADLVKGYPATDIQVYELYNTRPQIAARTHPNILNTQRSLLSLWHTSSPNPKLIDLQTPLSYFDRLRIRNPGDASFALGPHIDGGSIERWQDDAYRTCWSSILAGGSKWRNHDPFDASPRLDANQDLYHGSSQCSVFRPFQGWTSLSSTGANEGTLRVFPLLSLATSYTILRPFFKLREGAAADSLKIEDWVTDLDSPTFPGSALGGGQELNEKTHPHLKLGETMLSIPRVEPGDQVYWHCDVIHAVEPVHHGNSDSSVFYIPAVPLTLRNADYLHDQRAGFLSGIPPPDFPGGVGETYFKNRAVADEVKSTEARLALGLEPFPNPNKENFLNEVNKILFG